MEIIIQIWILFKTHLGHKWRCWVFSGQFLNSVKGKQFAKLMLILSIFSTSNKWSFSTYYKLCMTKDYESMSCWKYWFQNQQFAQKFDWNYNMYYELRSFKLLQIDFFPICMILHLPFKLPSKYCHSHILICPLYLADSLKKIPEPWLKKPPLHIILSGRLKVRKTISRISSTHEDKSEFFSITIYELVFLVLRFGVTS